MNFKEKTYILLLNCFSFRIHVPSNRLSNDDICPHENETITLKSFCQMMLVIFLSSLICAGLLFICILVRLFIIQSLGQGSTHRLSAWIPGLGLGQLDLMVSGRRPNYSARSMWRRRFQVMILKTSAHFRYLWFIFDCNPTKMHYFWYIKCLKIMMHFRRICNKNQSLM